MSKLREFWAKVPLPWQLWIKGLGWAVAAGVGADVVAPMLNAWQAGQPYQFALDRKVWAMVIGMAWAYKKTHPLPAWDGQERRGG